MASDTQAHVDGITSVTTIRIVGEPPGAAVERAAYMPGSDEPLVFGVRPELASHYGVSPGRFPSRATTNDVFAASVASCLAGTFAGSLGARGITITGENLTAVSRANMGPSEGSGRWVIRSIHVRLLLKLPSEQHAAARRVHGFFDRDCWLSQTLRGSECLVSSELEFL